MPAKNNLLKVLSVIAILAMTFSNIQPSIAQAQGGDGLKRQVNAQSGKLSFIGPENGRALSATKALGTFIQPQEPAMALAKRFGPEFGLKDPEQELAEMKENPSGDGGITVHFQQKHEGIPVMGGELIVNTNEDGDLYSISGEVSPNLSLPTQPTIDSVQARESALGAMAKWYQKRPEDFTATEPELWIYDESLLQTSTRLVELVWRMEVTSGDKSLPVRELVLVNAERGGISLHFNQIDTAWTTSKQANTDSPPTPQATETPQPTETPDAEATPLPIMEEPQPSLDVSTLETTQPQVAELVAATWYVATTGNDSNSCLTTGAPCASIQAAVDKAAAGDTVKITVGTYTSTGAEVLSISKSITLSGGWNASFTVQIGASSINGENARGGIRKNCAAASLDHFIVMNGATYGGIDNCGDLFITNSSIQNNAAPSFNGAGIRSSYGDLILNNVTVSGNITSSFGGGIYIYNGNISLNNTTISKNVATSAGGIYISSYEGANVTIKNSVLAGNSYLDCAGPITSAGYNLVGNNYGCTFTSVTGDKVGTSDSPINARLSPLQNNGGATFTHALMVGSPAIDAGNPAIPGSDGNACLAADQRGVLRPVDARCDMGAYEGTVPWIPLPLVNTYTANLFSSLPGTFLCNQDQQPCTINNANPHANAAHKFAIGTSNFYGTRFNHDSIDNNGMVINSTVQYCDPNSPCPYDNAFWNGEQMVYGSARGYPLADDVVAHELTHGVTQYESNLFCYYQSGAINESFSDLFGEYYDQVGNTTAGDTPGVKWQMGEDVSGLGAIRSMNNPPAYGDPDRMTSSLYNKLPYYDPFWDNGGVHTNSGVNNKAVFLMVDGGTFNGKTVTALGWDKLGAIYYETNTNLLTSGADYSDLYYALQQACNNMIGQRGITSANCLEVKDAVDAVEMNAQPVPNFNTDAPVCDVGTIPSTIFADDLENGTSNWTFTNGSHPRWQYDSPYGQYAQSGSHSIYADDYPDIIADAQARLAAFMVPPNAYLHFAQAYEFEHNPSGNYDGGVLEYSSNGVSTWNDVGSLIQYNGYRGTIATGWNNPLQGRSAFVGSSHGYISTRLNLASLAGQMVSFRWRMGLDSSVAAVGWWVDNVTVYTCAPPILISGNAGAAGVTLSYLDGIVKTSISSVDGSYALPVSSNWSGTVTPSHPCFTFNPGSRSYTNLNGNMNAQNFTSIYNGSPLCATTVGVFRPSNGLLYLKNSNTSGIADIAINYGRGGDYPVTGDWDGDGDDTIGIYRNGAFYLRNSNTVGIADLQFPFGQPGDQPIAGDWNNDGVDTIGVVRPSTGQFLLRNNNTSGFADLAFYLGNPGDVGIAGDWNGDGTDTTGVFRPGNGVIYLKNTNVSGFADVELHYGNPGDKPVVGDWDNDGDTTIGIFRNGTFYLRNSNTVGIADIQFNLGNPADMPIAGNWDGIP